LQYQRTDRAFQSDDKGAGVTEPACVCEYKETINTTNAASHQPGPWSWVCKNSTDSAACNAAAGADAAAKAANVAAGKLPNWKGLDTLEKNALDNYFGSTGTRDGTSKLSVAAGSAAANSKRKAYDDLLVAFDKTTATEGEGSKRTTKRYEQLRWGLRRCLY